MIALRCDKTRPARRIHILGVYEYVAHARAKARQAKDRLPKHRGHRWRASRSRAGAICPARRRGPPRPFPAASRRRGARPRALDHGRRGARPKRSIVAGAGGLPCGSTRGRSTMGVEALDQALDRRGRWWPSLRLDARALDHGLDALDHRPRSARPRALDHGRRGARPKRSIVAGAGGLPCGSTRGRSTTGSTRWRPSLRRRGVEALDHRRSTTGRARQASRRSTIAVEALDRRAIRGPLAGVSIGQRHGSRELARKRSTTGARQRALRIEAGGIWPLAGEAAGGLSLRLDGPRETADCRLRRGRWRACRDRGGRILPLAGETATLDGLTARRWRSTACRPPTARRRDARPLCPIARRSTWGEARRIDAGEARRLDGSTARRGRGRSCEGW